MIEVEDNGQLKFSNHRQITPTPRSLFRYSFKDHLRAFNFFLHGEIAVKFRCFLVVSNRGKKFTSRSWEKTHVYRIKECENCVSISRPDGKV